MPTAFIDVLTDNFGDYSSGFWLTIRIVVVSFVIAMVVGTVIAALRVAPNRWLQRAGGVYVEFFRNIPLLVLLFIMFFGQRDQEIRITGYYAGVLSLGLYTAAYIADALRSGVFSVS